MTNQTSPRASRIAIATAVAPSTPKGQFRTTQSCRCYDFGIDCLRRPGEALVHHGSLSSSDRIAIRFRSGRARAASLPAAHRDFNLPGWLVCGASAHAELLTELTSRPESETTASGTRRSCRKSLSPRTGAPSRTNESARDSGAEREHARDWASGYEQSLAALGTRSAFQRSGQCPRSRSARRGYPIAESGDEPSVACMSTMCIIPAGSAALLNSTSIDHMEVEKGPQGTSSDVMPLAASSRYLPKSTGKPE